MPLHEGDGGGFQAVHEGTGSGFQTVYQGDGTVLWSSGTDILIIDDFEWGGPVSDRYGGQSVDDFEITTSGVVYEGSYSLKLNTANIDIASDPGDGLDNYVSKGDQFEFWQYPRSDSRAGFKFGAVKNGSGYSDGYVAGAHPNNENEFAIRKWDGGTNSFIASDITSPPTGEWVRCIIDWHDSNSPEPDDTIEATWYTTSGTELAYASVVDDSHAGNSGVGWDEIGGVGTSSPYSVSTFDGAKVVGNAGDTHSV